MSIIALSNLYGFAKSNVKNMPTNVGAPRSYQYLCVLNNNYSMLRLKLRYVTERQPNGFNDLQWL